MLKICGFRWNFTYSICNIRFKYFLFRVRHFDFRLNSHRIAQGDVAISSGDFCILKNKRSNIEFASKGDLRPVIQWSLSLSHFTIKSSTPPSLLWRNSIICRTIAKISTSFHRALLALEIRRSVMQKFRRATKIFKKTRGAAFAP